MGDVDPPLDHGGQPTPASASPPPFVVDVCGCVGASSTMATTSSTSLKDCLVDDASLGVLNVQLADKLDKIRGRDANLECPNFVCDCGKPLKDNLFFPCVLRSYLTTVVGSDAIVTGLVDALLKEYLKHRTEDTKLVSIFTPNNDQTTIDENNENVVLKESILNGIHDDSNIMEQDEPPSQDDVIQCKEINENIVETPLIEQNKQVAKDEDDCLDGFYKIFEENANADFETETCKLSNLLEDISTNFKPPEPKVDTSENFKITDTGTFELKLGAENGFILEKNTKLDGIEYKKYIQVTVNGEDEPRVLKLQRNVNVQFDEHSFEITKCIDVREESVDGEGPERADGPAKGVKVGCGAFEFEKRAKAAGEGGERRRRGASIGRGVRAATRGAQLRQAAVRRRPCRCASALGRRAVAVVRRARATSPAPPHEPDLSDETKELEEFERHERWASDVELELYSRNSQCLFDAADILRLAAVRGDVDTHLECYDELLDDHEDDAVNAFTMRGEQPTKGDAGAAAAPSKDLKLKSSIKKAKKCKKNRVTFNENKNEFFEADYIILIREECQYDEESDEGICTCSQHEMVRLACCDSECNGFEADSGSCLPPGEFGDQVALSPPEGYKDSGLFNQDGTFKDQSFFAQDRPGLLVSETTGAVFTPQHLRQLQVIQRLQREQLRRARASLDPEPAEERSEGGDEGSLIKDRPFNDKGFYAKEIVAGEERPKVNSGQQTTPTDEEADHYSGGPTRSQSDGRLVRDNSTNSNIDEIDSQMRHEPPPIDSSPIRLEGILKGGRLWKSLDSATIKVDSQQQIESEETGSCSNPASDEEGRVNRAVRFTEPPPREASTQADDAPKPNLPFRFGNHLLSNNSLRPNSAVRQLFPDGSHLVTPPQRSDDDKRYLVTTESLRAFEEAKRTRLPSTYRDEDVVRRNIDRNTLRRSLVKIDPRKKAPIKNDTSLTERIKMLTCNIEEDDVAEQEPEPETERTSPPGEEPRPMPIQQPTGKSFSPSSSSSASSCSSTSSTYKKLTEIFPKRQECISECNEEGNNVVIIPQNEKQQEQTDMRRQYLPKVIQCGRPGERLSLSSTGTEYSLTDIDSSLEMPAPDVLAGTPGAGDGDELAMFVQQDAARMERLRRRYQPSTENSDEDDQDDYGFQRRPSVRGIKPRFGSTNEILQQMQAQMQMNTTSTTTRPGHVSWPYYSESNLTQPAQHDHTLHNSDSIHSRTSTEDFQQNIKMGSTIELATQTSRDCYDLRNHNVPEHHQYIEHMQHKRIMDDSIYQNCVTYANIRCSVSERDLYSSQTSLLPVGQITHMGSGYENQARNHRRPESPPPIRSYHQTMVLIPYNNLHQPRYSNTVERGYPHTHTMTGEPNGGHPNYPHQSINDQTTLLKAGQTPQQIVGIPFTQSGVPMQITCSAPAHIRTVPSRPVARHMICYSEKVEPPLYQPAPGSPVAVRGVPEGAPAPAASPTAPHAYPSQNSLYYAMNV